MTTDDGDRSPGAKEPGKPLRRLKAVGTMMMPMIAGAVSTPITIQTTKARLRLAGRAGAVAWA
ncbi:hypothetical protein [Amycolatopsis sp. lyj-346]|uniref:hypothetical protein n=1 Tax=Amycolatopsis sp. lyj-346 TaxID=2789289 RepID=UPI003978E31A